MSQADESAVEQSVGEKADRPVGEVGPQRRFNVPVSGVSSP
jgi:hypothetical protein